MIDAEVRGSLKKSIFHKFFCSGMFLIPKVSSRIYRMNSQCIATRFSSSNFCIFHPWIPEFGMHSAQHPFPYSFRVEYLFWHAFTFARLNTHKNMLPYFSHAYLIERCYTHDILWTIFARWCTSSRPCAGQKGTTPFNPVSCVVRPATVVRSVVSYLIFL